MWEPDILLFPDDDDFNDNDDDNFDDDCLVVGIL